MNRYLCHTNIDEGRGKTWPTDFVRCPQIGEYVQSASGLRLKVCGLVHTMKSRMDEYYPVIEVELTR